MSGTPSKSISPSEVQNPIQVHQHRMTAFTHKLMCQLAICLMVSFTVGGAIGAVLARFNGIQIFKAFEFVPVVAICVLVLVSCALLHFGLRRYITAVSMQLENMTLKSRQNMDTDPSDRHHGRLTTASTPQNKHPQQG
jgi:uncharacterized membrane protein YgaE (UPF0421/DUF939 family)